MHLLNRLLSVERSDQMTKLILISFPLLVVSIYELDSPLFMDWGQDMRLLANSCLISYYCLMLFGLDARQKLMALIFVPFAFLGESVFSLGFEMYQYRLGGVPLYIGFGHAIVFSVGVLICELESVQRYNKQLRIAAAGLYLLLLTLAVGLLNDTFSIFLTLVFMWVVSRKGYRTFYAVMGLLVIFVEVLGTTWGCWTWELHPVPGWMWLQTMNPPIGTFVFYVLADICVIKMTRFAAQRWNLAAGQALSNPNVTSPEVMRPEVARPQLSGPTDLGVQA